jgi:hypothetical protein
LGSLGQNTYRALVRLALIGASRQNRLGFEPGAVPAVAVTAGTAGEGMSERRQAMAHKGEDPIAAALAFKPLSGMLRWCIGLGSAGVQCP